MVNRRTPLSIGNCAGILLNADNLDSSACQRQGKRPRAAVEIEQTPASFVAKTGADQVQYVVAAATFT